VLEQTSEDISFGLYQPIFTFASSDEYKRRLIEARDRQMAMVRDDRAINCGVAWTVGNSRKDGERMQKQYSKLLLRAFNGECEAVMAKVAWNNITWMIVYIISNIGSFGETVYKIGMTRREDPMERVHELGDASVPFNFDVHAMIPSEDAPTLEAKLHRQFHHRRVNMVNLRREFFHVTLDEIEAFARSQGIGVQLTKAAEAQQYRETVEMRRAVSERVSPRPANERSGFAFPAAL